MKDVTVSAKVPANKEKGTEETIASVTVKYTDDIKEAVEVFGAEALLTNALANWKVTLQGNIRGALRKGETPESISARLTGAKMGVAQSGSKVDPIQAYLAMFQSATPEKQKEMLDSLRTKANK